MEPIVTEVGYKAGAIRSLATELYKLDRSPTMSAAEKASNARWLAGFMLQHTAEALRLLGDEKHGEEVHRLGAKLLTAAGRSKRNPTSSSSYELPAPPAKLPAGADAWLEIVVGNLHVGTPDEEVREILGKRLKRSKVKPEQRAAILDRAIQIHHRNLRIALDVWSGRFGSAEAENPSFSCSKNPLPPKVPEGRGITLEAGQFGWDFIIRHDDGRDLLIQSDWDYPGAAETFGWQGDERDLAGALEYLSEHVGDRVEDPGYFDAENPVYAERRAASVRPLKHGTLPADLWDQLRFKAKTASGAPVLQRFGKVWRLSMDHQDAEVLRHAVKGSAYVKFRKEDDRTRVHFRSPHGVEVALNSLVHHMHDGDKASGDLARDLLLVLGYEWR